MVLYFQACLEEGDAALVVAALDDIARARGMAQLARDTGLTREGLYKALSADGNPSFATIMKATKALGFTYMLKHRKTINDIHDTPRLSQRGVFVDGGRAHMGKC